MLKSSKPVLAATLFVTGLAVGTLSSHFDTSQPTGGLENAVNKVVQQVSPQSDLASFNQLAKQLKPSVVNISVVKRGSAPFYPGRSFELDGQGSGLILTSDGEILTNAHVVDGASEIVVKLHDGREIPANIVGTDSTTDLALLKMENVSDLQAVTLGDSEALEVGEWVMAIGNPFGLEETVTVGVLSAKGRVIGAGPYDDFLQTDTSINPGNSGGPLFNIKGEVVGINTAILKQGQGIGFSIPVNLAKQISDQLRSKGMVTRGYLGIGIQPLTPALKKSLSLAPETQGAIVASVQPQGPAASGGLQAGDVVTHLNDLEVRSDRELLKQVAALEPGSKVEITFLRDRNEKETQVVLDQRPGEERSVVNQPAPAPQQRYRVGVAVQDNPAHPGAVIAQVLPGSAAAKAGLRPGDVIQKVGTRTVQGASDFVSAVKQAPAGELGLLVTRQGQGLFVTID